MFTPRDGWTELTPSRPTSCQHQQSVCTVFVIHLANHGADVPACVISAHYVEKWSEQSGTVRNGGVHCVVETCRVGSDDVPAVMYRDRKRLVETDTIFRMAANDVW